MKKATSQRVKTYSFFCQPTCGLRRYPNGQLRFPTASPTGILQKRSDSFELEKAPDEHIASASSKPPSTTQQYAYGRLRNQYSRVDYKRAVEHEEASEGSEEKEKDDRESPWYRRNPTDAERRRSLFAESSRLTETSEEDTSESFQSDQSGQYCAYDIHDRNYEELECHLLQRSWHRQQTTDKRLCK